MVRGYSFFGLSLVYVIFEDGTDLYWARSRVLEYLNGLRQRLPQGVEPTLGPDATGVGWIYEYVLQSDSLDLSQLRSLQDWYIRYQLTSVPGVSEVASLGGFVKQYQVEVNPERLRAFNIPVTRVVQAIGSHNMDIGARVLEMGGREYMIRGLGYLQGIPDIDNVAVGVTPGGTPIRVRDIATVQTGPAPRRGAADWNGKGEVVAGIVVMRFGSDALKTIEAVKARLAEIRQGLPPGVRLRTAYDRSDLIHRAIDTLRDKLVEEAIQISGDDQSLGYSMRGLKIWMQAIPIIQASSQASVRLNLEDQKRYIQDARQLLKQAEEVLDKVQADDVLFDAPRKFARGTALLLAAQEAYASVLYSAITGDVTRQDIELLRAADKQLLDAGQRMIEASPVLGAALLNTGALKASIDVQREITRNLRILCERSLSPKEISRSASPRLAVYFLGTFLVLLFASKVSGLIAQLDAPALGFLILMSFIASLVGTFGFEALRCPYPTLHRRVGGPPGVVPLLDSLKGIFAPKPQPAVDKK